MIYLIGEIIVWLVIAAALGFGAAWLIRGALGSDQAAGASASEWSAKMSTAEADYAARAAAAEAVLARAKADLHAAAARAAALEAEGGQRAADLEAGVKVQLRAAEALAAERGATIEQLRTALVSANAQAMDRIAAAESRAAGLEAALEAAEESAAAAAAQAAPPADDGARAALEAEIAALRARIAELESAAPAAPAARTAKKARPEPPPGEDDLQMLSGLGPVMEKGLKAQGIVTFRALADLTPDAAKALGAAMRNNFADRFARDGWAAQADARHREKYGA